MSALALLRQTRVATFIGLFTTFLALSSPVLFISASSFLTMACMDLGLLSCFYVSISLLGVFGLSIMAEDQQFSDVPGCGIFGLSERREGRCLVSSDCAAARVWKASRDVGPNWTLMQNIRIIIPPLCLNEDGREMIYRGFLFASFTT